MHHLLRSSHAASPVPLRALRRYTRVAPLLCLLALAVSAQAAPRPSALEAEPRLQTEVTLAVKEEPLVDFLARVARLTGAALAATPDVADERITVFARSRPAHEVLAVVAEHLDYSWVRRTRGGTTELALMQTVAAKRREQALRGGREGDLAALREQLDEWQRLASSPEAEALARHSPEERRRRIEAIDERLHGRIVVEREGNSTSYNRVPVGPALPPADKEALRREMRLLLMLTPERFGGFNGLDAAARVYSVLPPEGRAALWLGEPVRFAFPRRKAGCRSPHRWRRTWWRAVSGTARTGMMRPPGGPFPFRSGR